MTHLPLFGYLSVPAISQGDASPYITHMSDDSRFIQALQSQVGEWQLEISETSIALMLDHWQSMCHANQAMNLTRITAPVDAAVKHYADSLVLMAAGPSAPVGGQALLDIGTGAGFPAVPLSVACPDLSVYAIDSRGKKIGFLADWLARVHIEKERCVGSYGEDGTNNAVEPVGAGNVSLSGRPERDTGIPADLMALNAIHAHSEHWDAERVFDRVVMRAVSPDRALRYAEPHVSRDGIVVIYSTPKASPFDASRFGLRPAGCFDYTLRIDDELIPRRLLFFSRAHS